MLAQRVEKHIIKPSNSYYALLDKFCFLSKNLYNHANFILRQEFINNSRTVSYGDLDRILKADDAHPDYRSMPTAQSAQQVLRIVGLTAKGKRLRNVYIPDMFENDAWKMIFENLKNN